MFCFNASAHLATSTRTEWSMTTSTGTCNTPDEKSVFEKKIKIFLEKTNRKRKQQNLNKKTTINQIKTEQGKHEESTESY